MATSQQIVAQLEALRQKEKESGIPAPQEEIQALRRDYTAAVDKEVKLELQASAKGLAFEQMLGKPGQ